MRLDPPLRAEVRRGAVIAISLVLAGMARVTQPTIELVAPNEVRAGDTVEIVLRVRNDHPTPIDLELAGRPVAFDIIITAADGREVWRRLDGAVVAAALMLLTLQPGETRDFSLQWDQVDGAGRAVPPGRYRVRGILPMGERRSMTATRELTIQPGLPNPASLHQR